MVSTTATTMIIKRSYGKRAPRILAMPSKYVGRLLVWMPKVTNAPCCITWVSPTATIRQGNTFPQNR